MRDGLPSDYVLLVVQDKSFSRLTRVLGAVSFDLIGEAPVQSSVILGVWRLSWAG